MKLLLDTHAFLWFVLGDSQLSSAAKAWIQDPANEKYLSPASYWEIAIKVSIGKLVLHEPYDDFMQRTIPGNGFIILPIEVKHASVVATLPLHHRDPFDRLIIAQAIVEQVPIVSGDKAFDAYPISRLW
jgi:PIN domain nuclease of toxin-antitoxin system